TVWVAADDYGRASARRAGDTRSCRVFLRARHELRCRRHHEYACWARRGPTDPPTRLSVCAGAAHL
ncbi:hypothetical protein HETIRDRAFT_140760, partial [Heterobasidion irregulare TC 32-1]